MEDAFSIQDHGDAGDDLEENLLLSPPPQMPRSLKRPRTPPTLLSIKPTLPPIPPQAHRNKKRALKRRIAVHEDGHSSSLRTLFEHVQLADTLKVAVGLEALPVAKGGYTALCFKGDDFGDDFAKEYTPAELAVLGFTVLHWDGRYAPKPTYTITFLD